MAQWRWLAAKEKIMSSMSGNGWRCLAAQWQYQRMSKVNGHQRNVSMVNTICGENGVSKWQRMKNQIIEMWLINLKWLANVWQTRYQ